MHAFGQDLKYGWRMLAKSPGLTAAVVLTLALGIGLNAALFGVVNAVLLKRLPVERPEQLVGLFDRAQDGVLTHAPLAFPDFRDLRDQCSSLDGTFGYVLQPMALDSGSESQFVMGEAATGGYFSTLGVRAALGRTFSAEDETGPGAAPVAVLSSTTWQRRFGADPAVLGKTIRLNGEPFTVIGIAPPEFAGLYRAIATELWVPMRWSGAKRQDDMENRGGRWLMAMGRLKPGVTFEQARAEAAAIGARLQRDHPETNKDRVVEAVRVNDVAIMPGLETVLYPASFVLLAVAGLVLLIACANIANLLLARATARRREFAVRLAIGAPRSRLVRQLLVESLLLALAGAAGGLLLATWSDAALVRALNSVALPFPVALTLDVAPDGRVLAYSLGLALFTMLAFGLAPALQASRADLATALKEESGTSTGGGNARRLRSSLVVAQVALSLVLLIGAGLCLRSLRHATQIDPGFRTDGVVKAAFAPEIRGYDALRSRQFFGQLLDRVRALPGVDSAALTSHVPLAFEIRSSPGAAEGKESLPVEQWAEIDRAAAGPGFFETIGMPVLRGRGFEAGDAAGRAVVNETLARQFWPGEDPVGRRLLLGGDREAVEVIGVVRDAKYRTLGEAPRPFLFRGFAESDYGQAVVIATTRSDPRALLGAIRRAAGGLDERVPVAGLQTLREATSVSLLLPRAGASLFGLLGLLGLALALVGLYGVMAYTVSQRTHEIGIRLALGARRRDVMSLVLGHGLRLTIVGLALGLVGAAAATRILTVVLYGVSPVDAATFAGVSALLTGIALLACWLPARRAARVDPMIALRYE